MPEEQWLRTPQAAIACGVSEKTLKRLRDEVEIARRERFDL